MCPTLAHFQRNLPRTPGSSPTMIKNRRRALLVMDKGFKAHVANLNLMREVCRKNNFDLSELIFGKEGSPSVQRKTHTEQEYVTSKAVKTTREWFFQLYEAMCASTDRGDVALLYLHVHGSFNESTRLQQFKLDGEVRISKSDLTRRSHGADERGLLYWILQSCHGGAPTPQPLMANTGMEATAELPKYVITLSCPVDCSSFGDKTGSEMTIVLQKVLCDTTEPTFENFEDQIESIRQQWQQDEFEKAINDFDCFKRSPLTATGDDLAGLSSTLLRLSRRLHPIVIDGIKSLSRDNSGHTIFGYCGPRAIGAPKVTDVELTLVRACAEADWIVANASAELASLHRNAIIKCAKPDWASMRAGNSGTEKWIRVFQKIGFDVEEEGYKAGQGEGAGGRAQRESKSHK